MNEQWVFMVALLALTMVNIGIGIYGTRATHFDIHIVEGRDSVELEKRADAIAAASRKARDLADQAYRAGDAEGRRFWLQVQSACSDEIQDVARALKVHAQ